MGKVVARIILGIIGLLLLAVVLITVLSTARWNRNYENFDVPVTTISIPADETAVTRGQHLATILYCGYCHGDNLAGDYLIDDPQLAVIPAPNLTVGAGGVGGDNTDEDWQRAIRHGVGRDGRSLIGMPARAWNQLSDEDLGASIAYLKTARPVDNELPARRIGPLFRLLLALGKAPQSEATVIDHDAIRLQAPEIGTTVDYGAYLAVSCIVCHGASLNGGTVRDFDGELITALNLTPGGALQAWSEEDFITTMRSGVTPSGRQLSDSMPWRYSGQMTDEELQALWLYLQSLPALEQDLERTDL
jgi:mono/diheme cytochrome c family protein